MPRPRSNNDTSLNLKLPGEWLDEAEALAGPLSEPGLALTRADVLRKALRRGLDDLRREATRRRGGR